MKSRRLSCLTGLLGLAVLLCGQALAASSPASTSLPEVTELRTGQHPDMTRFVIDIDRSVAFKVFTLADPYRVVIDLPEVDWRVPSASDRARGLIKGYRAGAFTPGTWRIVLEAAGPVGVKRAFLLSPREGHQYRLVVDLKSVSREAFLRTLDAEAKTGPKEAESKPFRRLVPKPKPFEKKIIVLDPGHGGVDPGTEGPGGVWEKNITLAMGRELRRELEATGRYRVIMTRDKDVFLRLRERVAIARAAKADLFISLHADSNPDPHVRGLSVYTLSEHASDQEAELLAAKENKSDIIAGMDLSKESPEVTNILIDLAQRETMNRSVNFAQFAVDELSRSVHLLDHTHRFAGFAVLKAPDVPSVLVELGYLSYRPEEKLLQSPAYRARLGAALVRAVDDYFSWSQALSKS